MPSTGNILDVAPQGGTGVSGGGLNAAPLGEHTVKGNPFLENERTCAPVVTKGHCADSQILDRHGDDRFAGNILRALEGLPQNGDAEEEEAAAEEGALIEASGYNDPVYERNGR